MYWVVSINFTVILICQRISKVWINSMFLFDFPGKDPNITKYPSPDCKRSLHGRQFTRWFTSSLWWLCWSSVTAWWLDSRPPLGAKVSHGSWGVYDLWRFVEMDMCAPKNHLYKVAHGSWGSKWWKGVMYGCMVMLANLWCMENKIRQWLGSAANGLV